MRELSTKNIEHLERMARLDNCSKSMLQKINSELKFRSSNRAKKLQTEVEKLLSIPAKQNSKRSSPAAHNTGATERAFKPTAEQEDCVRKFQTGNHLKINAFAGSGKTSTLQLIAGSTKKSGVYLAFNRSAKEHASGSFPKNVSCMTTHGLAFKAMRRQFRTEKLTKWLNAKALAQELQFRDIKVGEHSIMKASSFGFLVNQTIRKFTQSAEESIEYIDVPRVNGFLKMPDPVWFLVQKYAKQYAISVWERMTDPNDPLPMGHDGYLKLWALSKPKIETDFILLDEAQDTNPVVLKVIEDQASHSQIVYVGDRHQQIYEWRGAVNAMDKIETAETALLTQSFRFGQDIADAATSVLRKLGEKSTIIGNPQIRSSIGHANPNAILCRTNGTAMAEVINAIDADKKPYLVGDIDDLKLMVLGAASLKEGEPTTAPELAGFANWAEVLEVVENGEADHLKTFVGLVETRGTNQLLWALNRVVEKDMADITISTGHKAKGLEWNNVRVSDDFLISSSNGKAKEKTDFEAEARLFYVAITRARNILDVNPNIIRHYSGDKITKKGQYDLL